jgi:hypothetical protein
MLLYYTHLTRTGGQCISKTIFAYIPELDSILPLSDLRVVLPTKFSAPFTIVGASDGPSGVIDNVRLIKNAVHRDFATTMSVISFRPSLPSVCGARRPTSA